MYKSQPYLPQTLRQAELRAHVIYRTAQVRDVALKSVCDRNERGGDAVRVLSVGREATVLKPPDARGEVLVQAGAMRMSVKLADLRSVQKKPERPKPAAVRRTLAEPERSFLSLDLRGRMVDEATVEIDRFIDDAELAGVKEITLIHGKGTGALRAGVQAYLRTHPQVKSFRIGAYGEGDAGVTVVTLR